MSDLKQAILDTKAHVLSATSKPPVLNPEFLNAVTVDLLERLDEGELKRFSSVLEAARELSEGTYTGTAPAAHGRSLG